MHYKLYFQSTKTNKQIELMQWKVSAIWKTFTIKSLILTSMFVCLAHQSIWQVSPSVEAWHFSFHLTICCLWNKQYTFVIKNKTLLVTDFLFWSYETLNWPLLWKTDVLCDLNIRTREKKVFPEKKDVSMLFKTYLVLPKTDFEINKLLVSPFYTWSTYLKKPYEKLYGLFLNIRFICLKATEPLWGNSLLLNTKSPEVPGTNLNNLNKMKDWVVFP